MWPLRRSLSWAPSKQVQTGCAVHASVQHQHAMPQGTLLISLSANSLLCAWLGHARLSTGTMTSNSCPAASIPVVGFNAVLTSEHFGAFFTFAVLHAALAIRYIKARA
jgi:hypothetical protein